MGAPCPVLPYELIGRVTRELTYELIGRVTRELSIEEDKVCDAIEATESSGPPETAGDLIDLMCRAIPATPDSVVPAYVYPSRKEIEIEAFDRVRSAIAKVGARVPETLDDEIELPIDNPKRARAAAAKETATLRRKSCRLRDRCDGAFCGVRFTDFIRCLVWV